MRRIPESGARLCALALLLAASRAGALSDTDFQGAINYDFRPPGARSLAMAGAFTALSDDASGALNNPAGLTQLKRPEFTFAGKVWTSNFHLEWGMGSTGDFSSIGPIYSDHAYRTPRDSYASQAGPTFASYSIPWKRVAFSVFAGQLNRMRNSFLRDAIQVGPVYFDDCNTSPCTRYPAGVLETAPTAADAVIRHERYGVAVAFAMGNHFSAGLSGFLGHMRFDATTGRYLARVTLSKTNSLLYLDEHAADSAPGFTVGLLYRSEALQIGATYHRNEKFKATVRQSAGAAGYGLQLRADCPPVANSYFPAPGYPACEFPTTLRVPDRAALGLAWRPSPLLTLSGEAEYIRWRQMLDDFRSFQDAEHDHEYTLDNALNPHLGAEYVLLADTSPLSVRAGLWLERGHLLTARRALGTQFIDVGGGYFFEIPAESRNNGQRALYPGAGSQLHSTLGIGFVVGRLQFDAGYDRARDSRQFELSTVYRF